MADIIVFESVSEIIVGDAANINKLIEDWFLDGERNLDDYDTYLADGSEGVSISVSVRADIIKPGKEDAFFDVIDLMPNVLRDALIEKGLLTDETE